jgi:hypothetical protein
MKYSASTSKPRVSTAWRGFIPIGPTRSRKARCKLRRTGRCLLDITMDAITLSLPPARMAVHRAADSRRARRAKATRAKSFLIPDSPTTSTIC